MIRYTFIAILLFLGLASQTIAHNTIKDSNKDIAHRIHENIDSLSADRMGMFSITRDDDDDAKRKILKVKKDCLKKIKALKKKKSCKPCKCKRPRRGGRFDDGFDDDR